MIRNNVYNKYMFPIIPIVNAIPCNPISTKINPQQRINLDQVNNTNIDNEEKGQENHYYDKTYSKQV